jgi:hypothetical protein
MTSTRTATLGMALLVAIGMGRPTPAIAAETDIVNQVKTAKSAADHEALATYYEEKAADARKKAQLHRDMASSYTAGGTSSGKGGPILLPQHCEQLARMFDEQASQYADMAATHRELGKEAK